MARDTQITIGKKMKVYVGWDSREDIAYQVCEHSIKRRDPSAEVVPLKQNDMRSQGIYTREKDKLASTLFLTYMSLKVGQCSVTAIFYGRSLAIT